MAAIRFGRVLKLGSRGTDVRAVKRGLARAGQGKLRGSKNRLFGPFTVRHLKRFQEDNRLKVDGEYGPKTHKQLSKTFDDYARNLYEAPRPLPKPKDGLQLPRLFKATHPTGGLPGYPAIDVFAKPGTVVLCPEDGVIERLSGRDPRLGGSPGGSYGWSIYLKAKRVRYFLTHFGSRTVTVGQKVKAGDPLGTVCDSKVSGKPGTSHIHVGKHA